jgi:exodeoxyribonuclease V alpha subunit
MNQEFQRGLGLASASYQGKKNVSEYLFNHKNLFLKYISSPLEKRLTEKLLQTLEDGALCLDYSTLQSLESDLPKSLPEETLNSLEKLHIVSFDGRLYFQKTLDAEKRIAKALERFFTQRNLSHTLSITDPSIKLSSEQEQAIQHCLNNNFSIITGGPGTGKTTIVKLVVQNLINIGYHPSRIRIASPTGKAAKRLNESLTETIQKFAIQPACTLHRLLGHNPGTGKCFFHSENPIPAEVFLIDETSMADIYILDALLQAIPYTDSTKLILVGDPNQLLSVNQGALFTDLVSTGRNQIKLSNPYRQSIEGKEILDIIENIQNPKIDSLQKYQQKEVADKNGVQWIECLEKEEYYTNLKNWYEIYKSTNSQILTPFNKGDLGVTGINQLLDKLYPQAKPMILTTNLPELNLFNGETGYFIEREGGFSLTRSPNWEDTHDLPLFPFQFMDYFQPAYAITIHKSQGSEYENLCLILPSKDDLSQKRQSILTLRLLYTAITRAKKSLTILGSKLAWQKAQINSEMQRTSGLQKYWINNQGS